MYLPTQYCMIKAIRLSMPFHSFVKPDMLHRNKEACVADEAERSEVLEPARVYPAAGARGRWIVEAPVMTAAPRQAPHCFTGPNAQSRALRYAYEAFGSARFFPFPATDRDVPLA